MNLIRRLLAFILGLALAVASAVALVETIVALTGADAVVIPREQWIRTVSQLRWDDPAVVGVGVVLLLTGLLLLATALVPPRPQELALRGAQDSATSIDRRGLQDRLRDAALRDPDVTDASVRIRRAITVKAMVSRGTDRRACRDRVQRSIATSIDDLDLQQRPKVRAKVEPTRGRVR